jgi:two-component system, LytTR family, sensor kinase
LRFPRASETFIASPVNARKERHLMDPRPRVSDFDRLPPIARTTTRAEWVSLVVIWTFLIVRSIEPTTHWLRTTGIPTSHWPVAAHITFEVLVWVLATPFLFMAFDRTPVVRGARVRNFTLRFVLAGLAIVAHAALSRATLFALVSFMGANERLYTSDALDWQATLGYSAEGFGVVLLAHVVIQRIHRSRYRQRRAAELETSLAKAKLHALSNELQPHFLFNTLNGIAALVQEDPRLAETMLVRLGDLLRVTLDDGADGEISLGLELEHLDLYLDLQEMRFGPRLTVVRDIAPDVLKVQVPSMLLQPLVENALTHGIGPKPGPGEVRITARRLVDRVSITIEDTGTGLPPVVGESTGIRNTRARLSAMFSTEYHFALESRRDREGTIVTIQIPLRMTETATATADDRLTKGDQTAVPAVAGAVG